MLIFHGGCWTKTTEHGKCQLVNRKPLVDILLGLMELDSFDQRACCGVCGLAVAAAVLAAAPDAAPAEPVAVDIVVVATMVFAHVRFQELIAWPVKIAVDEEAKRCHVDKEDSLLASSQIWFRSWLEICRQSTVQPVHAVLLPRMIVGTANELAPSTA